MAYRGYRSDLPEPKRGEDGRFLFQETLDAKALAAVMGSKKPIESTEVKATYRALVHSCRAIAAQVDAGIAGYKKFEAMLRKVAAVWEHEATEQRKYGERQGGKLFEDQFVLDQTSALFQATMGGIQFPGDAQGSAGTGRISVVTTPAAFFATPPASPAPPRAAGRTPGPRDSGRGKNKTPPGSPRRSSSDSVMSVASSTSTFVGSGAQAGIPILHLNDYLRWVMTLNKAVLDPLSAYEKTLSSKRNKCLHSLSEVLSALDALRTKRKAQHDGACRTWQMLQVDAKKETDQYQDMVSKFNQKKRSIASKVEADIKVSTKKAKSSAKKYMKFTKSMQQHRKKAFKRFQAFEALTEQLGKDLEKAYTQTVPELLLQLENMERDRMDVTRKMLLKFFEIREAKLKDDVARIVRARERLVSTDANKYVGDFFQHCIQSHGPPARPIAQELPLPVPSAALKGGDENNDALLKSLAKPFNPAEDLRKIEAVAAQATSGDLASRRRNAMELMDNGSDTEETEESEDEDPLTESDVEEKDDDVIV